MQGNIILTGGTGTFGTNFLYRCLRQNLFSKITIFSRDEFKQHHMRLGLLSEFSSDLINNKVRFFIGNVRDKNRLMYAFRGADYVIHTAALKHVNLCEYNPQEAIKTNIIGTQNVVEAAIENGVSKVVCLSTDKCVDPINLYGSTKLCLEKMAINGNFLSKNIDRTIFSVVRYGNVIGSRGSVIPTILDAQEKGTIFTLTDPSMTRFWLTIDDAVDLSFFALNKMEGREIFVPKLKSLTMGDLVRFLAPDIEVKIVGRRPGEKLHEAMVSKHELYRTFRFSDYCYVILPEAAEEFITPLSYQPSLQTTGLEEYTSLSTERFEREEFLQIVQSALENEICN